MYFVAAAFIYGVAVPSGLFIPCMLIGGGYGRLIGVVVHTYISTEADAGIYALVGAAGMLGGVTHMTISLTAIIVEVAPLYSRPAPAPSYHHTPHHLLSSGDERHQLPAADHDHDPHCNVRLQVGCRIGV